MKRRFAVILVAGLFLSACGNDEVSTSCKKDETNCEGNQLLTCGDDGTFVKTTCENQICAKDGDKHRCMTQEEYDNLNHTQVTHDCEAEWAKCDSNVKFVCDADFHWQIAENCADSGKTCKQNDHAAACEQSTTTKNCTDGELDCSSDGKLKTCVSGDWQVTACSNGQTCMITGDPAVAGCVQNGTVTTSKNAKVNFSITNQSKNPITIKPKFRFVLSTEGKDSSYPYNRTEPATFAEGETITINSGDTKSYSNVEIPGDSKQYSGQHFARTDELNGYANNVLLYDKDGKSETIVPQMIDPTTLFTDGGSYQVVYNPATTPEPETGNAKINITIKNNTSAAITMQPTFRFVLSTEGKDSTYPYNRTEHARFAEGDTITINSGDTKSYSNVEVPGDSKQYTGQHFARTDELHGYVRNVLLYDEGGNSETILSQMIDPSTVFKDGGTYNIVIESGTTPPGPATGNVKVNITITNNSSSDLTIFSRFRFVLSTEGTSSDYPYNRTEAALFIDPEVLFTINPGETKTYDNVEIPDNSAQYVGQHFARRDELGEHPSNVLLYASPGYNTSIYVPQMIDPSTLFQDGATYHIVYGSK